MAEYCPRSPESLLERGVALSVDQCKDVCYGELTFLGYNGGLNPSLPISNNASHKFYLFRKEQADGVRATPSTHIVKTPNLSDAVRNSALHSVCYTIARDKNLVVEYELDGLTDKFQLGRSSERTIDILLTDSVVECEVCPGVCPGVGPLLTVSRYACRLQADRADAHNVRLYAAGFDQHGNIFLGCKAHKWQTKTGYDGLTTNGILVSQPVGEFGVSCEAGSWREVSINGNVYTRRIASRSARECGSLVEEEENVLRDGALVDLCGATFMFRQADKLRSSPSKFYLEESLAKLNAGRPECPVTLHTLIVPRRGGEHGLTQPYVNVTCGHVQGKHEWGLEGGGQKKCPMCEQVGPVIKLCLGYEPSFYVDSGSLSQAFNPCGHIATAATVKYWSEIEIPKGDTFVPVCPFCLVELDKEVPSVRLIFQDYTSYHDRD